MQWSVAIIYFGRAKVIDFTNTVAGSCYNIQQMFLTIHIFSLFNRKTAESLPVFTKMILTGAKIVYILEREMNISVFSSKLPAVYYVRLKMLKDLWFWEISFKAFWKCIAAQLHI